jgi:(p)ppGpp synthase/HD superfamily hydrolase
VTLPHQTSSRLRAHNRKNLQSQKRSRRLTKRFREALLYATELHADQTRKGTDEPYIGHLLGVASLVLQYGGNENEAIAGLLHDAVEDQGGHATLQKIKKKFGTRVAAIVEACSDSFEIPKLPWLERKKEHLAKIGRASRSVRLVYAADKLHNARCILADYQAIGERLWKRFSGGKEGTLWYYREMAKALEKRDAGPLVKELRQVVAEIEKLAGGPAQGYVRGVFSETRLAEKTTFR